MSTLSAETQSRAAPTPQRRTPARDHHTVQLPSMTRPPPSERRPGPAPCTGGVARTPEHPRSLTPYRDAITPDGTSRRLAARCRTGRTWAQAGSRIRGRTSPEARSHAGTGDSACPNVSAHSAVRLAQQTSRSNQTGPARMYAFAYAKSLLSAAEHPLDRSPPRPAPAPHRAVLAVPADALGKDGDGDGDQDLGGQPAPPRPRSAHRPGSRS